MAIAERNLQGARRESEEWQQCRSLKPRTTDSQPVAPNQLVRDYIATAPNRKWVGEITAIATRSGWLCLAGSLDLSYWAVADFHAQRAICDGEKDRRNNQVSFADYRRLANRCDRLDGCWHLFAEVAYPVFRTHVFCSLV